MKYYNWTDNDVPRPREHTGGARASRNLSGLYTVMDPVTGGWIASHDSVRAEP